MSEVAKIEGAVAKKVYMHYEEGEDEAKHLTLKLTLPSKWAGHSIDYLKEFFLENYNKKRPENVLDPAFFHLEKKSSSLVALHGDELIHHGISKGDDLFLKPGTSTKKPLKTEAPVVNKAKDNSNLLRCKNYGCAKKYAEDENHEEACRHHLKPPVFHDTKKGWQCCSSKMVYDWDEFEKIEPCAVGSHSNLDPGALFAKSPTVQAAENASSGNSTTPAPAPVLKSIDDYNKTNPNAVTAVSSAVDNLNVSKPVVTKDGKFRCVNFGCQQEYLEEQNTETSCQHHNGPPVFHDTGKYWTCCPKEVKYDFEDFLKVPGCVKSKHSNVKTA